MKGLKFIIFLGVIFFLMVLFMLPFYYNDVEALISDLNRGTRTVSSVVNDFAVYLKDVNSWSVIGFLFLAASILLIHSVVDMFILHRLDRFYSGIYFLDGMLWLGKRILSLIMATLFFILVANLYVDFHANRRIASTPDDIKANQKYTILLLGTNKNLEDGVSENVYYTNRINAVVELYEKGYVSHIWISGDNSKENYNEPRDMKLSLMQRGVPKNIIHMDHAGLRTLDSIVRSKILFDLDDILIVSQGFHLQRALFLAWHFNADAWGYEAEGSMTRAMFFRELLAVPKMLLDILVLNTQPKYGTTEAAGVYEPVRLNQRDLVLIIFILIYLGISVYLSYDAFDFGKK